MQKSPNLDNINKSLSKIASDVTVMDMLISFDKVLEDTGIYAYKNWLAGELVEGPDISRYWFTTTWMWHKKEMPDPDAGLRLVSKGCKVYFYKDVLLVPSKVKGPESFENQNSKNMKEIKHDVWCVKIEMPRRLIDNKVTDYVDLENIIHIDTSESDKLYDEDIDDQMKDDDLDQEEFE